MNRKQRRTAAKHGNPYQAAQAQLEGDLRRALRVHGVELISVAAGAQNEESRVIVHVKRGEQTVFMQSPPKTVKGLVAGIVARLDGKDVEPTLVELVVAKEAAPTPSPTTAAPGNGERPEPVYTDLSKYLEST